MTDEVMIPPGVIWPIPPIAAICGWCIPMPGAMDVATMPGAIDVGIICGAIPGCAM